MYPLSAAGLWLAVIITPAAMPSWRTANASRGVGQGRGSMCTAMPAPASTPAASSANSADRCRASQPSTTPRLAVPSLASQPATAAVAALTTARFIRFGPAATTPRSPAVPKCSRSANRSRSSATAAPASRPPAPAPAPRPPRSGTRSRPRAAPSGRKRPVEQRLQLGPVARIRVVRDPGLYRRPQLSLTRHLPHSSQSALTNARTVRFPPR